MTEVEKKVLKAVVSHCRDEFDNALKIEFDNLIFEKYGPEEYFKIERALHQLMLARHYC